MEKKMMLGSPSINAQSSLADTGFLLSHPSSRKGKPSLGTMNRRASLIAQCKEFACNAGDPSLILGSGRSTGEGIGYPHQYSCLENPMNRGAWQAVVIKLDVTEAT